MTWIRRQLPVSGHAEKRGQILAIFALMFTVILGFAGLALDATHLYLVQHQAQKAADAAALAAGKRLAGGTQQSPPLTLGSNDPSAIAAHDFAAADGFASIRATSCETTTTVGSLTQWVATWYDVAAPGCLTSGYGTAVSIAIPPYQPLTPHCQVTPYNCTQITITSRTPNLVMSALGMPTSTVSASSVAYAQPTGYVFQYPYPAAVYLYEQAVAAIASCPAGQQCFDRTKPPARSQMDCGLASSNCPTFWVQNSIGTLIAGVDGTTLNPPTDTVVMESSGDMVMNSFAVFCDPYGVGITACLASLAVGSKGFAVKTATSAPYAPGKMYCNPVFSGGSLTPTACSSPGPGGTPLAGVWGNETGFLSKTWAPIVDISGLPSCGTVVLNGDTVANSGSLCPSPSNEPYALVPGIYNSIVANHGAYHFEPGIYDITGTATVNTNTTGYANGIDHSREVAADWDLCTTAAGNPKACPNLKAGVWIGRGSLSNAPAATTTYGACGSFGTQLGGGGDQTSITAHGVVFRFEPGSAGFVSTAEVSYLGFTAPGLGQMRQVGGAPLLFDMENNHFIHVDASGTALGGTSTLSSFSGIIYQMSSATGGGVEVNPGIATRFDGEMGGTVPNTVVGQIYAYSLTFFGNLGAMDFSNGTGGAATPTVTTSGNQENSILVSSVLVAGPTPTTESLVVKYVDEWGLDAYDVYVKINAANPVYFSDGIWNPRPTGGQTLPPNGPTNSPSDASGREAYPIPAQDPLNHYTHVIDSAGDPDWTMTYPVGGIYGNADGSTFRIEGDWAWGHERNLTGAVRGNDFATLTYTFPVPVGQTVAISMFMTDGDRCGDYVTTTWTFNNVGTPAPGVQVIGVVRLEQ